jgi:hypothetical protein
MVFLMAVSLNWNILKNKLLLLFFLMLASESFAQLKLVAKIDTIAKAIYADNLDYVYLLTEKDELLKYNMFGQLKWRYSNNRFGKIKSVDVSDPLRVVLFFADFQQVVVLNNNLNEIATYSFVRNSDLLVVALASSNNNGFWAFDRSANVLLKLSNNFTEDMRSANFFQLFDQIVVPKKLVASDQFVYLQRDNNQILQFDRFGGYVKQLSIDSLSDFNITSNKIAYLNKNAISLYDLSTGDTERLTSDRFIDMRQVAVGNKIIAALNEKAVFLLSK